MLLCGGVGGGLLGKCSTGEGIVLRCLIRKVHQGLLVCRLSPFEAMSMSDYSITWLNCTGCILPPQMRKTSFCEKRL